MGMDFVTLLRYAGPGAPVLRALDALEAGSPAELQAVARLLGARGFSLGDEAAAVWKVHHRGEVREPTLDRRPALPKLGAALHLPEGFLLTFGPDTVEAHHLLRWGFFLTEPALQGVMLDACLCLARLFGATEGILTSDFSPVVHAFRAGLGFDAALASAGPEDGARPGLADLYTEIADDQVMRVVPRPGGGERTQYRVWDRGRPPPEGWERVTTWESRGYWRLDLGACLPVPAAPLPLPPGSEASPAQRPARVARLREEDWWAASWEPDAMLDWLFKQDAAGWRKVRLWACACARRLWARLATEPSRRAVEVVERFADGQTTQQSVDNAERAASVRKGDRGANAAAALVARLCSATFRFPPGDVSETVVEAVAGSADQPAARVAERQAHAHLLRDIFGAAPGRSVTVESRWQTPAVVALAQAAYDDRPLPAGTLDPDRLAVLADALEEAGCTDAELLTHLRGPGPHVRGCWVVDSLLGKQ
jgi:hypothetical protein